MDIRHKIDTSRMSAYQWVIVAIATFLNALDGFDVLAMAFTATSVTDEFGLTGSQLGWLLSAGLIGMAIGALCAGPLADRYGRRTVLLLSISLSTIGMFLSSTVSSVVELGLWRVLTGLGVGGILASVTVLISEYSNNRNRGMAISIYTAGYSLGATIGGLGATQLIPAFGWRSVFLAGAVATGVALLLVVALLPESTDYYRVRRPKNVDEKITRIAHRIGLDGEFKLGPAPVVEGRQQSSVGALMNGRYRASTLLLWVSFFSIMFGWYFANSWTPKLLVESGMSEQQGIVGGLMLTTGGTVGALLYGVLTTKWDARLTLAAFTGLGAVTLIVFITTTALPAVAFASGVVVGMLISGCLAGLYTVAPQTYAPEVRTTGVGWGIGIGRIGAIVAPIIVGSLLDTGWTPTQLYIGVAVVVGLSALAMLRLRPYTAPHSPIPVSKPTESSVTAG